MFGGSPWCKNKFSQLYHNLAMVWIYLHYVLNLQILVCNIKMLNWCNYSRQVFQNGYLYTFVMSLTLRRILLFGGQTLQDCKDALSPFLQGDTEKKENVPQINESAKECIKKLNIEFQTKMSDDLQTLVILTGALQEALKFVNSSLKMLKVCIRNQFHVLNMPGSCMLFPESEMHHRVSSRKRCRKGHNCNWFNLYWKLRKKLEKFWTY